MTLEQRFWEKVKKTDACWKWMGSQYGSGYARMMVHEQQRKAHEWLWELSHGVIPEGQSVVQTCGNKACVKPEHLALEASQ